MTGDPVSVVLEALIALLVLVGAFFGLVGSWGLVKLPDLLTRLHAPTKATTLGVGSLLIASMLTALWQGGFSIHELVITLFLFITAPVVSQMAAKVWLHQHADRKSLPRTGRKAGWATFDPPPEPRDAGLKAAQRRD